MEDAIQAFDEYWQRKKGLYPSGGLDIKAIHEVAFYAGWKAGQMAIENLAHNIMLESGEVDDVR